MCEIDSTAVRDNDEKYPSEIRRKELLGEYRPCFIYLNRRCLSVVIS